MKFYQWIFNRDQSIWMLAYFQPDGDGFTVCDDRNTYRIIDRSPEGGEATAGIAGSSKFVLIRFGPIVEPPPKPEGL